VRRALKVTFPKARGVRLLRGLLLILLGAAFSYVIFQFPGQTSRTVTVPPYERASPTVRHAHHDRRPPPPIRIYTSPKQCHHCTTQHRAEGTSGHGVTQNLTLGERIERETREADSHLINHPGESIGERVRRELQAPHK
jgi:hypothetical protein